MILDPNNPEERTPSFDEMLAATKVIKKQQARGTNRNFFMMFKTDDRYENMLRAKNGKWAAIIFHFFARHANRSNALVASVEAIAEHLDISRSSAQRGIRYLKQNQLVDSAYNGRDATVWILNPQIIWASWHSKKSTCQFGNAHVLLTRNAARGYFNSLPVIFAKAR